ncbi:ATP-binding protein [Imperialibacter roseus]|uniref:histidine kinase n=1 Tax=Imperialibacter roseus TaxID=1324217 RepID=A0ABZ0ITZ3_9BACT|nr:ATP-binding protein [Imperialibacter roseus]WOK07884.1 ATP-binding protein [Imperialibacter roseus]
MLHWILKIQNIGVEPHMSKALKRSVILSNSLSLMIATMPILFTLLVSITQGTALITVPLVTQPLFVLTPILLNAVRWTTASRILLSWITPAVIISYSIINKTNGLDMQVSSYVGFRITMVASSILPFLLFTPAERWLMFLTLGLSSFTVISFDAVHTFFGVGFSNASLADSSYQLTNIRAFMGIVIIGSCALILKNSFEKSEAENEELIEELGRRNTEIKTQLREIQNQQKSIQSQKDLIEHQYNIILQREARLMSNEEKLTQANKVIKSQHDLLLSKNIDLQQKLIEQNDMLEKANQDLIKMNADLHHFMYMASHHLRGPIATLHGLINLVPRKKLDEELSDLLDRGIDELGALNNVVDDLNHIDTIKNQLLHPVEKIFWDKIVASVLEQYEQEIRELGIVIKLDLNQAPYITTIRSLLYDILDKIINNAIKFRSPERPLMVTISCKLDEDKLILEIADNGMGINMSYFGDRVFGLYKRFHENTAGKGLGLYFVKAETELLEGSISVRSVVDQHTTFTLKFPIAPSH